MNTNVVDSVNNKYRYFEKLKLLLSQIQNDNGQQMATSLICFYLAPPGTNIEADAIRFDLNYLGLPYATFSYTDFTLQQLYDKGYRIFIGLNPSTLFLSFIPFFQSHPDTYGISTTASSSDPAIINRPVTNMYRLTPSVNNVVPYLCDFIANGPSATAVGTGTQFLRYNLFQQDGDNFSINLCQNLLSKLTTTPYLYLTGAIYNINNTTDIDNALTASNAKTSSTGITVMTFTTTSLRNYFYNAISTGNSGYYIENVTATPPPIASSLAGNYYFSAFNPVFERNVEDLVSDVGINNTSFFLFDSLNMANSLAYTNSLTSGVIGSYGYLYFNATGDRTYYNYTISSFDGSDWSIDRQYLVTNETPSQLLRGSPL